MVYSSMHAHGFYPAQERIVLILVFPDRLVSLSEDAVVPHNDLGESTCSKLFCSNRTVAILAVTATGQS